MKALVTLALALAFMANCSTAAAVEQLAYYPLDSLDGVLEQTLVSLDKENSHDDAGALRIDTTGPVIVRLFETGDLDVEDARIVYQAVLSSENLQGQAYLEMWCVFDGMGEYFSRALHAPISGNTDWQVQETPFFLKAGQNPVEIRLNLVVTGAGTVWIDEVRLLRMPLQ